MVGCSSPDQLGDLRGWIRAGGLGGVFLFGRAVGPAEETAEAVGRLQEAAGAAPLFVAVDQEGGRVQAWGPPWCEALPPAAEVGALCAADGGVRRVRELARRVGVGLRRLGVNLNFAPVLDVDSNPDNPIIGDRAYGSTPERVSRAGRAFIEGLHAAGVLACGKHFPGHGDTATDSHLELPVVGHDRARLERIELAPFRDAVRSGLEVIMTAHVLYPALDADRPATVSPTIVSGLLRKELGFDGVVVTDDLKMRGIRDEHDLLEASLASIRAGCDLLLSATEHDRHAELLEALDKAVADGLLPSARLEASRRRIERVKRRWLTRA